MRCSKDIRNRVLAFVADGGSKAEAARRYQVSRATVYNWLSSEDGLSYRKPGPKKPRKLDWEALRRCVEQDPDRMLKEYAEQFGVSPSTIWKACERMKLTRKKRRVAAKKRRITKRTGAGI
jgi:transposase